MNEDELLEAVTRHYLDSGDFNGLPLRLVEGAADDVKATVERLMRAGRIVLDFGDRHPNPYILAFASEPVDEQIAKLHKTDDLTHVCAYPSPSALADAVNVAEFAGRPFTLLLAQGRPQLEPVFFDLMILEEYRNDPRYSYSTSDVEGHISYRDGEHLHEQDQILLQTFGFAVDRDNLRRYVGVYLRYLSDLTPEHQQRWASRQLTGNLALHPDYVRSSMGEWPERPSIYESFVEEQHHINEMAALMRRPPFWRDEFRGDDRPRTFGFLLRPTLNEFNAFVHTLDRMCSDNINVDFFGNDVELDEEIQRADGRLEVRRKGSIRLLDEWLDRVRFEDLEPRRAMIAAFRRIRNLRNSPAHTLRPDEFDQTYIQQQRELMIEAYGAVRTLRLHCREPSGGARLRSTRVVQDRPVDVLKRAP
jgi:hypothetical protein